MKYAPTSAYLLHSRRYRDTSLIADFMTADHGRLSCVAKGASNPKSSYRHILQPAQPLIISASGKGELLTLNIAEERERLSLPVGRFFSLTYINELMLKSLAKMDPHPEVFAIYEQALLQLSDASVDEEWALRYFEYQLLTHVGMMAAFEQHFTDPSQLDASAWYAYHPEYGLCSKDHYHESIAPLISGEAILSILQTQPLAASQTEARRSLKRVMRRMVDMSVPSGIKSRDVMRSALRAQIQKESI